jgi:hypothetical protein
MGCVVMKRLLHRLLHKAEQFRYLSGYIIHSEFRRFPKDGVLTKLCVWDGEQWHQAPVTMWDKRDGVPYLEIWMDNMFGRDAFRHRDS